MRRPYLVANYRIFRGRRVVENAFLFDKVKDIVLACMMLHSMLRAQRGAGGQGEKMRIYPVSWRMVIQVMGMKRTPLTVPRNRGTTGRSGSMVLVLCPGRMGRCD